MRHAYPLMLDVTDRLVVIVGGGNVAARKAGRLLKCGATRVRCVAPTFAQNLPAEVERVAERYESRHLDGAGLVFATTDVPAVNQSVVEDAQSRGVLVCRSDAVEDDDRGDFTTPIELRLAGGVIITVSTGSPWLSGRILLHVREKWDPRLSRMAEAMRVIRPAIRGRSDLAPSRRDEIVDRAVSDSAMDMLDREGVDGFRRWMASQFPELGDHA